MTKIRRPCWRKQIPDTRTVNEIHLFNLQHDRYEVIFMIFLAVEDAGTAETETKEISFALP